MKTLNNTNKYPYAYDEHGNMISIDNAVKMNHRKWYLDPGLQIELILLCNLPKQVDHWRTLSNQKININGVSYEYSHDKDSESFEHKQFKFNILEKKCINIKEYKVFLVNPREEIRIIDSKFRADVLANLECGTQCVIEIIKTSDLSDKKQEFIEKNQILTFKIYIDEHGNQISQRDNIIGVTEISEIARRIQDGEGKLAELKDKISRERGDGEKRLWNAKKIYRRNIDEQLFVKRGPGLFNWEMYDDRTTHTSDRIRDFEEQISILEQSIKQYQENDKSYIDIIKRYQEKINRLRNLEQTVYQIIEDCKPEWFGNQPKGVDKVSHILYQIT